MPISIPREADTNEKRRRERYLFVQREAYQWVHAPGQPPYVRGVPPGEAFSEQKNQLLEFDLAMSVANLARATIARLFRKNTTVESFRRYYPLEPAPAVAKRWATDVEFGRQRLDGINPLLLELATEVPERFPVTDETIEGLVPEDWSLDRLRAERRLFLLDYRVLEGFTPVKGRFCVAPICLFWRDDRGRLMPLAIQLGQSPAQAPTLFTPKHPKWTWLLARSYVQSADATYHEIISHLTRTHLTMEPFWVAACRTLPPQHPLHVLLKPHFSGTIEINHGARTRLIAPGGPIDETISIGAEGSLDLIAQEYGKWSFALTNPIEQIESRGLGSDEILPNYHYRDDATRLFGVIKTYVEELLRAFYEDDRAVQEDAELQAWAEELVSDEGARIRGLPYQGARIPTFQALHTIVSQVIFTVSVQHAAVNNGQYAMFGWIPNVPGALYLPPPTDGEPRSEAHFVYALPDGTAVASQLMLVHLLSQRTEHPLGVYPGDFFQPDRAARMAVDRFRAELDDAGRAIQARNRELEVPYEFLQPWLVPRSIAI